VQHTIDNALAVNLTVHKNYTTTRSLNCVYKWLCYVLLRDYVFTVDAHVTATHDHWPTE